MAYDREKKRWTRDVPLSRGDKGLARRGNYSGGQYSSLNKVGRKGRDSARALRVFKKECARLGIERCEVRYEGCTGEPDTWAHGRKRRFLKDGELETYAVVACLACHRRLDEGMSHEQMASEVARIIGLRPERYLEAA